MSIPFTRVPTLAVSLLVTIAKVAQKAGEDGSQTAREYADYYQYVYDDGPCLNVNRV